MTDLPDDAAALVQDRRRAPFCYQTLDTLAVIRAQFTGAKRSTALAVYLSMTETANRIGGAEARKGFRAARAVVAEAAGVSVDTLDRYAAEFVKLGLLIIEREKIGEVHLPNTWILTDTADVQGVAAGLRPGGSRTGAAQDLEEQEQDLEAEHPPAPLVRHEPNRPGKVGRKPVTDDEYEQALAVLAAFNTVAATSYSSVDFVAKIVGRIREHPDLTTADHYAVIRHSFQRPWWTDAASPSVVYGNAGLFERSLQAARTASEAPAAHLTPEEMSTYGIEWGPGTSYETLADARRAPRADLELEAEEADDDASATD